MTALLHVENMTHYATMPDTGSWNYNLNIAPRQIFGLHRLTARKNHYFQPDHRGVHPH